MYNEENTNETEVIVNPEYDYSNIIPDKEYIKVLIRSCEEMYKRLQDLFKKDEEKNERLKYEYRNYEYKKHFETDFSIDIRETGIGDGSLGQHLNFTDSNTFSDYIDRKVNLDSLVINLNLSYKRGSDGNEKAHLNSFKISFKPYNIKFKRKSNYNDEVMNQIESYLKSILDKFMTKNTIFCNK